MQHYLILISAILPVVILLIYIYFKDHKNPEPIGQLHKAFWWGVFSVFVSFLVSIPCHEFGLFPDKASDFFDALRISFIGAAIPEEGAKLFVLWLFLRKNKYFDENTDGVVYAVCVSLGFAAFENVCYLFSAGDKWLSVGTGRALFSVPGHMFFGILMGYYYSLITFQPSPSIKNKILVICAPVLAHGLFNSMLYTMSISSPVLVGILTIAFLAFVIRMWFYGSKRIRELQKKDGVA